MAIQLINLGTPDQGDGDKPRASWTKANDNFSELDTRTAQVSPDTDPTDRNVGTPFAEAVMDGDGKTVCGLDHKGRWAFKPSRRAEMWIPPTAMRGHPTVTNVRYHGRDGTVAQWQDSDGKICEIYQQNIRSSTSAIAISSRGIRQWLGIGQSHMNESSGLPTIPTYTKNPFPKHVGMIQNALTHDGSLLWSSYASPSDDTISYAPSPGASAQSILAMAMIAITQFERDASIENPVRIGTVSQKGSMPIEAFFPGSAPGGTAVYIHENAVEETERVADCASRYPIMDYSLDVILFLQGENDNTTGTPWGTQFAAWVDTDAVPEYMAAAGQDTAPKIIFMQTATASNDTVPSANGLEQLAFARSRATTAFALAGPMYPYEMFAGTFIHIGDLGRMRVGEVIAVAALHAEAGTPFHGLRPVAGGATRVNNVITIPMEFPPECTTLTFDTDTVGTSGVTNHGCVFSQTGGNSPIIQSVAFSGTDLIVTLDITPTGSSKTVSYAHANNPNTTGWATGRGTIYTEDPRDSVFYRLGQDVPAKVRHYCSTFQEAVS